MNPPSGLRVRRATTDDVHDLAALRYEFRAWRSAALEPRDAFIERFRAWMDVHLLDADHWRVWVLESDSGITSGIAGNIWLQIIDKLPNPGDEPERHGYVTNFFVHDAVRGRGAGTRLLAALLDECAALDVDRIFLWPSARSRPLYARHGFKANDEVLILER